MSNATTTPASVNNVTIPMHDPQASQPAPPPATRPMDPAMVKAHKRHRIASIDLEIARLRHEKATLRAELAGG